MSSSSDTEECMEAHSPAHAPPPPRLEEIKKNLTRVHNSVECMDFCVLIDNIIQGIDTYDFQISTAKNQFSFVAYNMQEEIRSLYVSLKKTEMDMEKETHDDLLRQWGIITEKELAEFDPVTNKKQKNRPLSPVTDTTSAKKVKKDWDNQYQVLTVDDPPSDQQPDVQMDAPSRSSSPVQRIRPPPPITIDNVNHPAQLLKRIQTMTKEKLTARTRGKSIKLYPETPEAYHRIRKLIDDEKLEAFTFQFPSEKEYRVVIRGIPADMPVNEVVENLEELGIHPKECRVLINRKTGQPMPIFSIFLEKNEDNRNIYNLKELCFMKIVVETMRGKIGPAQCYRCQGFFHGSKLCTRNPKCVKCGKPHLTKDCTKTKNEDPTCCHCQGNHPANYLGCPQNPLNRPPPPPKVNFWEERARIKKEMQEAAKNKINPPAPLTSQQNNQTKETSSSHPPQTRSSTHQPQTKFVPRQVQMTPSTPQTRTQETPSSSRNVPLNRTEATKPIENSQDLPSLLDTLSQVNDPEVQEMIAVIEKFIAISKSNKPTAHKAMELFYLLKIKI
ncbi:RNA-directed DNA polymerase from mobile element jockey [Trichonephila clavata]|uniref:RNA-directed DNA polymerase from mobile element jockey n=1 Tax=Trichonephila clavata TaxID=2740835 RepID=A0A8X6FDX1_TRICU|nr:RNA-directed DNA polymerase from mobile element jockey [Trichonephila clavata]